MIYKLQCDGHTIEEIHTDAPFTKLQHDEIRKVKAKEYKIPQHYLKLIKAVRVKK